jgi:hypothetical protein
VSINVWGLAGDTLNITCNFLYYNDQVQRDYLITLYYKAVINHHRQHNISARHTVGLYLVPGHVGVRGNEITDKLARYGSVQTFVGPEPFLGVSMQNIRTTIKGWVDNQHLVLWCGPCSTQRQAGELILGPKLATRARLLSSGLLLVCLLDITP